MFAVTSKYEVLQVAIQRENRLWLKKPRRLSILFGNKLDQRMPIVRFLFVYFFPLSLDSAVFEGRGREKYIFLTFERQPRLHSNMGRESKHDLFLSKRCERNDSERMIDRIARCVSAHTHNARTVQFLTRLIRYSRYRLSDIYFSERIENRACCRSTGGRNCESNLIGNTETRVDRREPERMGARSRARKHALSARDYWVTGIKIGETPKTGARDGTYPGTVRCVIPGRTGPGDDFQSYGAVDQPLSAAFWNV